VTSKEHKKHADIQKPLGGKFNRNEIAIIGAPCGIIQRLSENISKKINGLNVGYVDAEHGSTTSHDIYHRKYTDKIGFHQIDFNDQDFEYSTRSLFNDCDLTLINGNHFLAENQVVIINENKKESLQKKLDRLTNVRFFILDKDQEELHSYLLEHNPAYKNLPVFSIEDTEGITNEILKFVDSNSPKVKGLVLAGGKSTRMGFDKGEIDYHGKPQREYMADVLSRYCDEVFLSVRDSGQFESEYPQLVDSFSELGPYGGILSAFRQDPNAAWLVVATDIPLLSKETIQLLLERRDISKVATCFHNPETNFPEPLITLWEPKAYQRLLMFLSLGYSCPRKALINSDIIEIELEDHSPLFNANTPEEKEEVLSKLNG